MLSKRYKSTEVDRRTWLYLPSGNRVFKIISSCACFRENCKKKATLL